MGSSYQIKYNLSLYTHTTQIKFLRKTIHFSCQKLKCTLWIIFSAPHIRTFGEKKKKTDFQNVEDINFDLFWFIITALLNSSIALCIERACVSIKGEEWKFSSANETTRNKFRKFTFCRRNWRNTQGRDGRVVFLASENQRRACR